MRHRNVYDEWDRRRLHAPTNNDAFDGPGVIVESRWRPRASKLESDSRLLGINAPASRFVGLRRMIRPLLGLNRLEVTAGWEVRQNAVWRRGRVFFRCPRCTRNYKDSLWVAVSSHACFELRNGTGHCPGPTRSDVNGSVSPASDGPSDRNTCGAVPWRPASMPAPATVP